MPVHCFIRRGCCGEIKSTSARGLRKNFFFPLFKTCSDLDVICSHTCPHFHPWSISRQDITSLPEPQQETITQKELESDVDFTEDFIGRIERFSSHILMLTACSCSTWYSVLWSQNCWVKILALPLTVWPWASYLNSMNFLFCKLWTKHSRVLGFVK